MQELKVIGVEDGALVAASEDGARFRIEIDEVLQSRIRHAVPETHTGPRLSPREVQAHIRSGLAAEEVAELTGASVDYIRRFEGPVLAEREHVITSALAVPMHAPGDPDGDEPASFGSVVRERLAGLGAHGERWASWKDEERGWMVKLEFTADGIDHDARWSFEPRKQALHPQNADAATLSKQGEVRGGMIPRLRAVSPDDESSRFDSGAFTFDASDTADDDTAPQPEVSAPRPPAPASSPAAARAAIKRADEPAPPTGETADLLEALRRRRGERESVTGAPERMPQPAPFAPVPSPAVHVEAPAAPAPAPAPHAPEASAAESDVTQPDESPAGSAARALWGGKASSASRPKKGRAAMPSWDEIVFGARTDDDLA